MDDSRTEGRRVCRRPVRGTAIDDEDLVESVTCSLDRGPHALLFVKAGNHKREPGLDRHQDIILMARELRKDIEYDVLNRDAEI
jgi:hypothetical protein